MKRLKDNRYLSDNEYQYLLKEFWEKARELEKFFASVDAIVNNKRP